MRKSLLSAFAALTCAGAIVSAQATDEKSQETSTPPAAADTMPESSASTTLTGCLYLANEVPGADANVAALGSDLDYVLVTSSTGQAQAEADVDADVELQADADPQAEVGTLEPDVDRQARGIEQGAEPGTAGTSGTAEAEIQSTSNYLLVHQDEDRLRELRGKRVQLTGRTVEEQAEPIGTAGTDVADTAERRDAALEGGENEMTHFEVATIDEAAGTCPAAR